MRKSLAWSAAFTTSLAIHAAVVYGLANLVSTQTNQAHASIELSDGAVDIATQLAEPVQQSTVAESAVEAVETNAAAAASDVAVAATVESNEQSASTDSSNAMTATDSSDIAVAVDEIPTLAADTSMAVDQNTSQSAHSVEAEPQTPGVSSSPDVVPVPDSTKTTNVDSSTSVAQEATVQTATAATETRQASSSDLPAVQEQLSAPVAANDSSPATVAQSVEQPATQPVASVAASETVQETVEPETQVTMIVKPPQPALPEKIDHTAAIKSYLSTNDGGTCFLTLPRTIDPDGADVDGIGADPAKFQKWETGFKTSVGAKLTLRQRRVDQLQCSTLDLVKAFVAPESSSFVLDIVNTELRDGADLQANISHLSLKWLSVLLVDDEGMISDVSNSLSPVDDHYALKVPVHLSGTGQGKNQLLVAISSAKKLDLLEIGSKVKADDILPLVMGEKKAKGIKTEVSIAVFQVK
jgi:hypothetical protein